jgi:hypothetical protein
MNFQKENIRAPMGASQACRSIKKITKSRLQIGARRSQISEIWLFKLEEHFRNRRVLSSTVNETRLIIGKL